jgi:hypothetical protein
MIKVIATVALGLSLVACGDKPQVMTGKGVKNDAAPHTGVGASQYMGEGWKAGDRGSWEQQLKARAQYGQNDYTRASN